MKRQLPWLLLGAGVGTLVLTACGLSPEALRAIETVHQLEAQGRITAEQASALIAGFEATSYGVRDAVADLLWAAGIYFGVMARRGAPATGAERATRAMRAATKKPR